jgi:hypothetical protein
MHADRIIAPKIKEKPAHWAIALSKLHDLTAGFEKKPGLRFLLGTDLTTQELSAVIEFQRQYFQSAHILSFTSEGIQTSAQDGPEDGILRRLAKTANLKGAEALQIKPFTSADAKQAGIFTVLITSGRAVWPASLPGPVAAIGVFLEPQVNSFELILPMAGFAEKSGTVTNSDGLVQTMQQAIPPVGQSKQLQEILGMWAYVRTKGASVA